MTVMALKSQVVELITRLPEGEHDCGQNVGVQEEGGKEEKPEIGPGSQGRGVLPEKAVSNPPTCTSQQQRAAFTCHAGRVSPVHARCPQGHDDSWR